MENDGLLQKQEQTVREICSISALFASCSHPLSSTRKLGFIDWYLILKVDEDSGSEVIKKKYRQLALLIHPDKNKHPKAEVAFKLVSEAYACLSDKAKRKTFNSERRKNFCKDCHKKIKTPNTSHKNYKDGSTSQKNYKDGSKYKQYKIFHAFREVQNRLKEECRVIEHCLRVKEANGSESPIFDPSSRTNFPDYPHYRERFIYFGNFSCSSEYYWKGRHESPIYQIREEKINDNWRTRGFRF